MNQALVFIKPHVVSNKSVKSFIYEVFKKNSIYVLDTYEISGKEIRQKGLIDKHYAINAKVGTIKDPSDLHIKDDTKLNFLNYFGESWDEAVSANKVFSGAETLVKLNDISPDELLKMWADYGAKKITGGMYVSYFKEEDLYVLNGFYPSIREEYISDSSAILIHTVEFDPEKLSWKQFRAEVVGLTNPADAHPNSIRGLLYREGKDKFDIEVNCTDNIIHGSASPFEAFVEKSVWIDEFDACTDPLFNQLEEKGFSKQKIIELFYTNPVVEIESEEDHLVDLLEDKNTEEVAHDLISLL